MAPAAVAALRGSSAYPPADADAGALLRLDAWIRRPRAPTTRRWPPTSLSLHDAGRAPASAALTVTAPETFRKRYRPAWSVAVDSCWPLLLSVTVASTIAAPFVRLSLTWPDKVNVGGSTVAGKDCVADRSCGSRAVISMSPAAACRAPRGPRWQTASPGVRGPRKHPAGAPAGVYTRRVGRPSPAGGVHVAVLVGQRRHRRRRPGGRRCDARVAADSEVEPQGRPA